jgi:hypothetical protein
VKSNVPSGPIVILHLFTKARQPPSFRIFIPQGDFIRYCSRNTEFLVESDHGPPREGAANFRTRRWTIVMRAAQSRAQGGRAALAEFLTAEEIFDARWAMAVLAEALRRLRQEYAAAGETSMQPEKAPV